MRTAPAWTHSTCRACGLPVAYGEAASARKFSSKFRHGFVHIRPCLVDEIERRRVAKARQWENAGQGVFEGMGAS